MNHLTLKPLKPLKLKDTSPQTSKGLHLKPGAATSVHSMGVVEWKTRIIGTRTQKVNCKVWHCKVFRCLPLGGHQRNKFM